MPRLASSLQLDTCTDAQDGAAIQAIFNHAILHSTALYEYEPRSRERIREWFGAKTAGAFPVLGLRDAAGELAGFASYGPYRPYPAFKYTREHSVYVAEAWRGRGVGQRLLTELTAVAERQGVHVLIGAIDTANTASIRLHERNGFVDCGTVRQAGFKFGRWLDVVFYQKVLQSPLEPVDG